ncbi:GNAT family N-acetyltransferase [Fredinandcohnia sp. 179-A 10B2 NHS]|uniref:GNAT family N-acetyltransferase n=1 Tax=Fredinandcohnia sp. 179-A 10B2 NHS TaxID=3235176 RepID=UPI0039A0CE16
MNSVMDVDLAKIVEQAEIDCLSSRLSAIQEIAGNPMGVDIKQFGNATAFSVKNIPGPSFNTIKGLHNEDNDFIEQIIDYYNEKKIPIRFELTPAHVSSEILTYLNDLGFYQCDFHTTLYQTGTKIEIPSYEGVLIRKIKEDEFDIFADIYTRGFQMPSFLKEGVAQNNSILFNKEGWTFYLASVNDVAAGIGVLYQKNGIANLAAAATSPEHRGKGVQSALIKERIKQAMVDNCQLVVGQAKFGSTSQRNMERLGMKIAYTKAIWVRK